jgi:eukaryotic-like serine/threonine-protein kinase
MEAGQELGPQRRVAGRYRVHDLIGQGGMGSVWHATDETLDREVAIKCVRLDNQPDADRALTRQRTLREARIAAKLLHPNIVTIFDIIERDEPWLILEFVPSRSLASIIAERRMLPPTDVAAVGAQIAAALAAAHRAGVVHRDVKPDNILIAHPPDGDPLGQHHLTAKLTDFGISRAANTPTLTITGMLAGTPAYFAPETARGEGTDAATDVYSLGATLYTATEGRPPFGADHDNVLALLGRIARGDAPPPRHAGELTGLLRQLLADDPAARPTAAVAQQALQQIATAASAPTQRRPDETIVDPARDHTGELTVPGAAPPWDPPERPAPPPAPPSAPRQMTRRSIIIGAVLAAAVGVPGVVIANNLPAGPGTGTSPADGRTVISAPRTADPCSLVNRTALGRHGNVEIDRGNVPFAACRADIGGSADLFVELDGPAQTAPSGGTQQRHGPLTIARYEADDTGTRCYRRIQLPDGNAVLVYAESSTSGTALDLCAIAETGATTAADALIASGIGTRADMDTPLARIDACRLIQTADLAGIPGLETSVGKPKFANWGCSWARATRSGVSAILDFYRSTRPTEAGVAATFSGRPGTLYFRPGEYCSAFIPDGDAAGGGTHRIDFVRIYVYGSQPEAELCGYATKLASAAAAKLPPTS